MHTINIDTNRYALPEGMTSKEIQQLAGFLVTLRRVDSEYMWGQQAESLYFCDKGAEISIGEITAVSREEAKAQGKKAREEYNAKEAAAKAAATAAA